MTIAITQATKRAELASASSSAELMVLAGTILIMILSCFCVVVVSAGANEASETTAKITYAAPAAGAAVDLTASTGVAGVLP